MGRRSYRHANQNRCAYRKLHPAGARRQNRAMLCRMAELLQLIWSVLSGLFRSRVSVGFNSDRDRENFPPERRFQSLKFHLEFYDDTIEIAREGNKRGPLRPALLCNDCAPWSIHNRSRSYSK